MKSKMAYFRKRDNGWEYRISYKDSDGKYKQKSKSGFKTKALANQAAIEAERTLQNDIYIDDKITLLDYFKKWSEIHKKPNVSTITWKSYELSLIHIFAPCGFRSSQLLLLRFWEKQLILFQKLHSS